MLGALSACGAAQPKAPIALAPVTIKVRTTPSGKRVYVRDFGTLVEEASQAFEAKDWVAAAELYDIIVDEYPDREGLGPVYFNAGLAYMKLKRPKQAAARFREAIRGGAGSRDARDAVFLLASATLAQGQVRRAAAIYGAMLDDARVIQLIGGELGVLDRLEASARQGLLLKRVGDVHAANRAFRRTQRIYDRFRDLRPVATSDWVVRAYFERGEIFRGLFESITFKLPVARMERDLEDKANLFLKAQSHYFRAVRLHHKRWSLAAGFHIGNLYARLIDDIYKAEVPKGLDALTVQTYREELLKHTSKLARRAVRVFEKNIELAKRIGAGGAWVERSRTQLDRMKRLLREEAARKAKADEAAEEAAAKKSGKKARRRTKRRRRGLQRDPARRPKIGSGT